MPSVTPSVSPPQEGRHHELQDSEDLPEDQLALLQSQDLRYIRQRRQLETKKLARLTAELHLLDADGKPRNTHVFFTDDKKQGMRQGVLVDKCLA